MVSKLHLGSFALLACALALGLAWELRENAQLRAAAASLPARRGASVPELEQQVAVQTRRVAAAEAKVAALLDAAKQSRAVRRPIATASPPTVDAAEVLQAAIARAKQLLAVGRSREALDEYVGCYRELQTLRPGSSECQQLMGAMQHLARTFPDARSALVALRDSALAQRQNDPGRSELVFEIALLNERLGNGDRTLALFDALPPQDIGRQSLAMIANSSFIAARRYSDALLGKPFGQMLSWIESGARQIAQQDLSRQPALRAELVNTTATHIEVLTGAGQLAEARTLTEKLLAFDESEATRLCLRQHIARATAPRP